jgi:hypothetical protein
MEPHVYSEGIDAEVDDDYWLSQENVESWEQISSRVEKGNVGTREIYRKKIQYDEEFVTYSLAKTFFENFDPKYADIPKARIEEENGETYLLTEEVTGNRSRLGEKEAFGFASEMVILGETDWDSDRNVILGDKPILQDFEYFGKYLINDSNDYKQNRLEPWFRKNGMEFDEERFETELAMRAEELGDPEEITETLEEIETQNTKQEEIKQETIENLEETLERTEDLSVEYISTKVSAT